MSERFDFQHDCSDPQEALRQPTFMQFNEMQVTLRSWLRLAARASSSSRYIRRMLHMPLPPNRCRDLKPNTHTRRVSSREALVSENGNPRSNTMLHWVLAHETRQLPPISACPTIFLYNIKDIATTFLGKIQVLNCVEFITYLSSTCLSQSVFSTATQINP